MFYLCCEEELRPLGLSSRKTKATSQLTRQNLRFSDQKIERIKGHVHVASRYHLSLELLDLVKYLCSA